MGILDFDRAIDSTFSTALGLTAKMVGIVASGTFSAVRNAAASFQDGRRIKRTALASKNNRRVWLSSSVNKQELHINDDPYFDDTETIRDENNEPALGYIAGESELPESIIISGGTNEDRSKALIPFVLKSQNNSMPIVVIHDSDSVLESMITSCCKVCELVSRDESYCDIFAGLIPDDIVSLICYTIGDDKLKEGTEPLLYALVNVVLTRRPEACIEDMASFPLDKLRDEINSLKTLGVLKDSEYSAWSVDYDAGSKAKDFVRSFLKRLNTDFKSIFGEEKPKRSHIKRTLNNKGVVMIDIGKCNAELAVKLLMNYLLLLDKNNHAFNIIIDDLPISRFPEFSDLLRDRVYAVSHSDFIASLSLSRSKNNHENNSEELFMDLTRDAGLVAVFRHNSMVSCRKWSEYFGTYRKIKVQREHTRSGGWLNYSRSDSLSEHEQDLPRVREASISRLPSGTACVYRSEGIFIGSI